MGREMYGPGDRKHTLLLVDDEPSVTSGLKRRLRKEPYKVLTANSGTQALDILAGEEVHVVISDEQMPGMSGSELMTKVRDLYPNTIRMILTGHASIEAAMRAINQGQICRFMVKPTNEADFLMNIASAIREKCLYEENLILHKQLREKSDLLDHLEGSYPGITVVERDASGAIVINMDED